MAQANEMRKFSFTSSALPGDTFVVVRFSGTEGLSQYYWFDVDLVSTKADLDVDDILASPATFTIKGKNGEIPFHGILASFEQKQKMDDYVFYRASIAPRLWWLTLTHHNQVFLNKKLDGFVGGVLKDGGLATGKDVQFKLTGSYPEWEYVCQYGESHYDFVNRWLERDGCYYYFDQSGGAEKLVITDSHMSHTPMPQGDTLHYSPPSGLAHAHRDEIVTEFVLRQTPLPQKLLLKDYNYRKPGLELEGKAQVKQDGRGEMYYYGDNFRDGSEGNHLATVRAEAFKCREKLFHGASTIPYVRTGYTFSLDKHYRSDFNQSYLTIACHHQGSQAAYLLNGLRVDVGQENGNDELFYTNTFTAIPSSVQFRPERTTERPRIHGTINAKIDAAGSGQYAELDDHGRYKVKLPFDLSGRKDGKASAYIRMMQPYAGANMGMHFPLHKGTEVLLSFIEGDPDRPVISGAIPNPETKSPVKSSNQTMANITTGSGNRMHMQDKQGSEMIIVHVPKSQTFMRLGQPDTSEASEGKDAEKPEGLHFSTEHDTHLETQNYIGEVKKDYKFDIAGDFERETKGNEKVEVGGQRSCEVKGENEHFVHEDSLSYGYSGEKSFTVGYSLEAKLAESAALEFGFAQEAAFVAKWTFHEAHECFKTEHSDLNAMKNLLHGEVDKLEGEINELMGTQNALCGAVDHLNGEVSVLNGVTNKLTGEQSTLAGSVERLEGEVNDLKGEVNSISGDTVNITANINIISVLVEII